MDDRHAFEQRLTDELQHMAGPQRAVDARAIRVRAQAISPGRAVSSFTQRLAGRVSAAPAGQGSSLSSALALAAVTAIVVLAVGLLLAGGLTTQQDPAPATRMPSGLSTEEVEPGVLRILADGAGHGLPDIKDGGPIYAGPDGSVWLVTSEGWSEQQGGDAEQEGRALWQLGAPGIHEMSDEGFPDGHDFAMAADGTLWVAGWSHLASFDGETWTVHHPDGSLPAEGGCPHSIAVEVLPDGTVWAAWCDRMGVLGPEGWQYFTEEDDQMAEIFEDVVQMPDGSVMAMDARHGRVIRFDGSAGLPVAIVEDAVASRVTGIRIAPDGTLWAHILTRSDTHPSAIGDAAHDELWIDGPPEEHLARLDGDTWTVYSAADGLPILSHPLETQGPEWGVRPDGSVWVLADPDPADYRGSDPDDLDWTLMSFDGKTWSSHGDGFGWLRVGPDGTVWAGRPDERTSGDYAERLHLASYDGTAWRDYESIEHPDLWGGLDIAPDGTTWVLAESGLFAIVPDRS